MQLFEPIIYETSSKKVMSIWSKNPCISRFVQNPHNDKVNDFPFDISLYDNIYAIFLVENWKTLPLG